MIFGKFEGFVQETNRSEQRKSQKRPVEINTARDKRN